MNPDYAKTPREELEARLTALLLDELSSEEAAATRRAIERDAKLAELFQQLRVTIELVRQASAGAANPGTPDAAPLRMSDDRRRVLLAHFQSKQSKPLPTIGFVQRRRTSWLVPVSLAVAMAVMLGIAAKFLFPEHFGQMSMDFGMAKTTPLSVTPLPARQMRGAEGAEAWDRQASSAERQAGIADFSRVNEPVAAPLALPRLEAMAGSAIVLPSQESKERYETATVFDDAEREKVNLYSWHAETRAGAGRGGASKSESELDFVQEGITPKYPTGAERGFLAVQPPASGLATVINGPLPAASSDGKAAVPATDNFSAGAATFGGFARGEPLQDGDQRNREWAGRYAVRGRDSDQDKGIALHDVPVVGDVPRVGDTINRYIPLAQSGVSSQSQPMPEPVAFPPAAPLVIPGDVDATPTYGLALKNGKAGEKTAGVPIPPPVSSAPPPAPRRLAAGERAAPVDQIHNLGVVGYAAVPLASKETPVAEVEESLRKKVSSIELPSAEADSSLAMERAKIPESRQRVATVARTLGEPQKPAATAAGAAKAKELVTNYFFADASQLGRDGRSDDSSRRLRPSNGEPTVAATDSARRTLAEAEQELKEALRFGDTLAMKIALEQTDSELPKTAGIAVVDKAVPAQKRSGGIAGLLGGSYASAARIKVEKDQQYDIAPLTEPRSYNTYDPYFIQTEFEVIQSNVVLSNAVRSLDLQKKWAREGRDGRKLESNEAILLLREKLEVKPVKNSSLVEIRAKSDDPQEAADIANAVAEAYRDFRAEQYRQLARGGIRALAKQKDEQQKKVKQAQAEVDRLRKQLTDVNQTSDARASAVEIDAPPARKPSTNAPIPQPEIQTSDNAFSTFSLNVSDVSFKLTAASLEQGQMPDAASVRAEEFINAFDYRDPEPPPGVPVAFAWERARYPFAHNRDLLRFSIKTGAAGRQAGRPLNLVLLLDNSGSMERADRVQIIREALRVLAGQLQPQDKLSVISFARTARLVADGVAGDKSGAVLDQVSGLTPQGGTNLEEAMNLGYATALRHYLANGLNRVVLLTDGAANLGNVEPESLKHKVEAHRRQGVALDCFGIGWEGLNDDLLEVLSRNGDGRYGFINSPHEAATEFAGQLAGALQVAASDVKVQVEFHPKRVTAYRQIGYAKHQLTKEQFRDNTVDAAEIAAQEAGNALYTVEVNPAGEGPLCIVRCRFKIPGTTDYREHEWAVPYTGNAVSLEQASPAMRLAASASAFAEWLVVSPFAAEITPDALLVYLGGVPEIYGADARPKKLEWMIRQAKSLAGK